MFVYKAWSNVLYFKPILLYSPELKVATWAKAVKSMFLGLFEPEESTFKAYQIFFGYIETV